MTIAEYLNSERNVFRYEFLIYFGITMLISVICVLHARRCMIKAGEFDHKKKYATLEMFYLPTFSSFIVGAVIALLQMSGQGYGWYMYRSIYVSLITSAIHNAFCYDKKKPIDGMAQLRRFNGHIIFWLLAFLYVASLESMAGPIFVIIGLTLAIPAHFLSKESEGAGCLAVFVFIFGVITLFTAFS